jgi:hypothetical protein
MRWRQAKDHAKCAGERRKEESMSQVSSINAAIRAAAAVLTIAITTT